MSITLRQLEDIGFVPSKKKSPFAKKYDTLIFPLNKTDYLYLGYNNITKGKDFKRIWKSFIDNEGKRTTYQVIHLGETGFTELKEYIDRHKSEVNV